MRFFRTILTLLVLVMLSTGVSAQRLALPSSHRSAQGARPITTAARVHALSNVQLDRRAAQSPQRPAREPRRSATRIVLGAAVGATAGFFAGGYLGSWIDGDCGGCDDPGLKGALIGAPIGAAAGGILGGKFLF